MPKPWSTRRFQTAVSQTAKRRDHNTKGTSYGSVYEYVEGKGSSDPPLSFLRIAAEVLDVRLEWLITGRGARTLAEQDTKSVVDTRTLRLKEAVLESIGRSTAPEIDSVQPIPTWVSSLSEVQLRLQILEWLPNPAKKLTDFRTGDVSLEVACETAIATAISGPLQALNVGVTPDEMSEETFGDYIAAMIPPLLALATEKTRQRRRTVTRATDEDSRDERSKPEETSDA